MTLLRYVIIPLLSGIFSSCLIRPKFYKARKNGKVENPSILIAIPILNIVVSFATAALVVARLNFYGYFLVIAICFFAQWISIKQEQWKQVVFIVMTIVVLFIGVFDFVLVDKVSLPDFNTEINREEYENKQVIKNDSSICKNLENDYEKFELLVMDTQNQIRVIKYKYKFSAENNTMRDIYPQNPYQVVDIIVSKDLTPYGVYAIEANKRPLGSYTIISYALYNLNTGEITELKSKEEVISFFS